MFRLYFKLINASFRSQLQYKASFLMLSAASFIAIFMDFIGVWVLFTRFNSVKGWTLDEILILYGVVHIGFSISESFARSFDKFSILVKNGDFDRILIRPLGSLFQVAASHVQVVKVGRFLQGLVILVIGYIKLHINVFSLETLILFFSIAGTAALFYGVFIVQATLVFWTKESLELLNIATYGSRELGQYPMSIYNTVFRLFFTIVLPLACVSYFPAASILHHENLPWEVALLIPFAGFLFLYFACRFWKKGERHYTSSGS